MSYTRTLCHTRRGSLKSSVSAQVTGGSAPTRDVVTRVTLARTSEPAAPRPRRHPDAANKVRLRLTLA